MEKTTRKHEIYLKKPARTWEDGLPLGNGRLGAMVMGKPEEETIFINEETLWYGADRDRKNPDTKKYLPKIRELLFEGKVEEAQFLAKMAMTSTPKYMNPYQPAGDLRICMFRHKGKAEGYERRLDIDHALAAVSYRMNGHQYHREHLVSRRYQVLAVRFTSDAPEGLTLSVNMSRKPFEEHTEKVDEHTVCNYGQCGVGGVHYFTGVRLVGQGGISGAIGDFAYVAGAREAWIYLACGTDYPAPDTYACSAGTEEGRFWDRFRSGQDSAGVGGAEGLSGQEYSVGGAEGLSGQKDPRVNLRGECLRRLDEAEKAGYEEIRRAHLEEYGALYGRMDLSLGQWRQPEKPTDVLLRDVREGKEESLTYLTETLFHYARFLMISSSYDCRMPANLQGLWNGEYVPPWQCEFTININTEMNYWMVEKCNLPECHQPLFDQVKRMVPKGQATARELYGCRGFCAHHNTNLWANTDPEGIFDASPFWSTGAAWLSLHFYEHYRYTGDREFLKREALPVMREAIRFYEDYLTENEEGYLVTGPGLSPENTYRTKEGEVGALCMGPAMDMEILRQLFTEYLEGCRELGLEEAAVPAGQGGPEADGIPWLSDVGSDIPKIREMLKKLPPIRTGGDGRILEWQEEYEETEPGHRHISHLYALHPGREITEENPELYQAARKTLETRLLSGGGHTGWSRAWILCFFARLKDGEQVGENIRKMLQTCIKDNLLDTHPPFQIDGNFGFAEAVLESLAQSHAGYLEFLPALPEFWPEGEVKGMLLEGGIRADFAWKEGELTRLLLTSGDDRMAALRFGGREQMVWLPKDKTKIVVG